MTHHHDDRAAVRRPRRTRRLAIAAATAAVAFGLVGAGMAGGARLARPTAVATINYDRIIAGLDEIAAKQVELEQLRQALAAEGQALQTAQQERFELMKQYDEQQASGTLDAAGEEAYATLRSAFQRADIAFEVWNQKAERRVDLERSIVFEQVFAGIAREVEAVANAGGYDLVLSDDSAGEMRADRSQANAALRLRARIAQRRVHFASPTVDVTQDVIDRMNNAWNAGG